MSQGIRIKIRTRRTLYSCSCRHRLQPPLRSTDLRQRAMRARARGLLTRLCLCRCLLSSLCSLLPSPSLLLLFLRSNSRTHSQPYLFFLLSIKVTILWGFGFRLPVWCVLLRLPSPPIVLVVLRVLRGFSWARHKPSSPWQKTKIFGQRRAKIWRLWSCAWYNIYNYESMPCCCTMTPCSLLSMLNKTN